MVLPERGPVLMLTRVGLPDHDADREGLRQDETGIHVERE